MPGASNIRRILRDTLAILVWHAVVSSLGNTFKALKDMPAWIPGFFSQVAQPQVNRFHSSDMCVACLFGKHVTPVRGTLVANGPSPPAFIIFCCASSRLPRFSICCPRSGEFSKCEAVNVWGKACMRLSAHVDVLARTEATALLSCNGARDTVFIYPSPSCHCCVWSEFAELGTLGELSNPLTLPTMQNVTAQHTPWILIMENKSWEGHSRNVQPLCDCPTLIFFCVQWNQGSDNYDSFYFPLLCIFNEHGIMSLLIRERMIIGFFLLPWKPWTSDTVNPRAIKYSWYIQCIKYNTTLWICWAIIAEPWRIKSPLFPLAFLQWKVLQNVVSQVKSLSEAY